MIDLLFWSCYGLLAVTTIINVRHTWYAGKRRQWYDLVHTYNMAMIEWYRAGHFDKFAGGDLYRHNLGNLFALGPHGYKLWDFRVWTLEGLVHPEMRGYYDSVMFFHHTGTFPDSVPHVTVQ